MTKLRLVLLLVLVGAAALLGYMRLREHVLRVRSAGLPVSQILQTRNIFLDNLFNDLADFSLPIAYARPESQWQANERQLYEKLLSGRHFDVVVAPLQVDGPGFDRSTRSLLTAQLASAIAASGTGKVADPFLIARAMGDGRRKYKLGEIYRIANLLGATRIFWGAVGHTDDTSFHISIFSQVRPVADGDKGWAASGSETRYGNLAAFGDEQSPLDVFERLLPAILQAHGLHSASDTASKPKNALNVAELPGSPLALLKGEPNPVRDAYTFILLGLLTPAQMERTRERFVEKAFVSIDRMSELSPEYKALRARAMMMMNYRGAALHTLGTPSNDEESEIHALLNGNLSQVRNLAAKEANPLKRLIEALDANSIAANYGLLESTASLESIQSLHLPGEGWPFLAARASTDWDAWSQFDNASLKALLDSEFPLKGYGLKDLVRGQLSVGDAETLQTTVDLSVFNHAWKYIENSATTGCCEATVLGGATPLDYLELLASIGHDNLLRHAHFLAEVQRSPERAIRYADSILPIYKGFPYYALVRAEAETYAAQRLMGAEQAGMRKSAFEDALNAIYWERSQSLVSSSAVNRIANLPSAEYGAIENPYYMDFPFHPNYEVWIGRGSPAVIRSNALAALKNATSQFDAITSIAENEQLADAAFLEEATRQIQGRFIGSPRRLRFLANQEMRRGNVGAAESMLRENIELAPNYRDSYLELGELLFESGRPADAAKVFLSFPGLRKNTSSSPVLVANTAHKMGSFFFSSGDFQFAVPLYRIAASQGSGSSREMHAATRLQFLDGDIDGALKSSLENARRYSDGEAYRDYLGILFASKRSVEAWSGFNTLAQQLDDRRIWEAALVGHHVAGATEQIVAEWAKQAELQRFGSETSFAIDCLAQFATMDRIPSRELSNTIATIDRRNWQFDDGAHSVVRPDAESRMLRILGPPGVTALGGMFPYVVLSDPNKHPVRSQLSYFVEGYRNIKLHNYAAAKKGLEEASTLYAMSSPETSYMLPYYTLATVKAGRDVSNIEGILGRFSIREQRFDYQLTKAILAAAHSNNREALAFLKLARYRRLQSNGRTLESAYTYGDVCGEIFEITKDPAIRIEALAWAKTQEKVQPWQAWAYALEASLSSDKSERAQALAMTYYLDPKSASLGRFSKAEIDEAVKQYSTLNVFSRKSTGAQKLPTIT